MSASFWRGLGIGIVLGGGIVGFVLVGVLAKIQEAWGGGSMP